MKSFLNAVEAKDKTFESLDKAIEEDLLRIQKQIQEAINNGDFSVEWTVSQGLETKHIARILEMLFNNDFAVYNENERLVSDLRTETFKDSKVLEINWLKSLKEAVEIENHIKYMNKISNAI